MNKIPHPSQRHIKQCNQRDSQFELLRIIAQFLIVWHHMIYVFQPKYLQSNTFFTAVDIPLHIGVIIFVLLSGYFTIKATSKGFIKIFGFFVVYSLSVVYYIISNASDIGDIVRSCLLHAFC